MLSRKDETHSIAPYGLCVFHAGRAYVSRKASPDGQEQPLETSLAKTNLSTAALRRKGHQVDEGNAVGTIAKAGRELRLGVYSVAIPEFLFSVRCTYSLPAQDIRKGHT
jgi:hypothetical protein